jgi:hypothetical protein
MSRKTPNHWTHKRRGVKPSSCGLGLGQTMLGLRCSCAGLLTNWTYLTISDSPGGVSVRLLMQDTQHRTHPMWYHTLFVCLFSKHTDIYKGLPPTTIGGHRTSQECFWGGCTYAKPSGLYSKVAILHQKGMVPGYSLVDVDLDGSACQPPW